MLGAVLAEDVFLAGNLRLAFSRARVLTPQLTAGGAAEGRAFLVIWRASASDGPPVAMAQWAARIARMPVETAGPPRHVTPGFGGSEPRTYRLGFLLLPPAASSR